MNWHNPDLYLFLFLLAGLATFSAVVYECTRKFRWKPPVVEPGRWTHLPSPPEYPPSPQQSSKETRPLDGPAAKQLRQPFESSEDLAPKEQAKRVRDHFGVFGGGRRGTT